MTSKPENIPSSSVRLHWMERLRQGPLFSDLTTDEIHLISHFLHEKSLRRGELLIEQDTVGKALFVLISGKMLVFRKGAYDETIRLGEVEAGECIGEMGYFSSGRRSASVLAAENAELVEITYADLARAFDYTPKLSRNFLQIITRRLHRSNLNFSETVQKARRIESAFTDFRQLIDLSQIQKYGLGIEGLIQRVVLTASAVLKAERATLFLVDAVSGDLWSKVAEGESHREIRIPIGAGIAGWVARNDAIINIENAYADPRFNPAVDKTTGYKTNTILCGPVKNLEGEIVGIIQVINKKKGVFDRQDEELFQAFAYQTAISVENFHLYNKMSGNCWKMGLFLDISMSLSETLELHPLITKIITIISRIIKADRSSLFLLDREKNELWSKVAQGAETTTIRFPATSGIAGYTATTGLTVNVTDAYTDPRFNPDHDRKTSYRTRSLLCVPLINRQGQIVGVLESINKNTGMFTAEDEELLRAVSSQIAVALENAQLYENTLEMKNYLENIQHSITNSILTLDNDFGIVTANDAALKFFSPRGGPVIGTDIRELLGNRNPEPVRKIQQVYTSGGEACEYDCALHLENTDRCVNINCQPLLDAKGRQKGQVVILEDISMEKRIKSTLTRYMAKDIAERLLNDPERAGLGGVSSEAAILFSDISDFTTISESLEPERVVDFLNHYHTLMCDIVFANGGILDKYIGDGIMAIFGVPYAREDDAARAVKTGLEMIDALSAFNVDIKHFGIDPVRIRIGIATGTVISGNIGSEKRMDYTVIGDGVNVSSRLENLNKIYGTTLLMEENTRQKIGDRFVARAIDHVRIKGRSRPVAIHEALGDKTFTFTQEQLFFVEGLEHYRKNDFSKAKHYFNLSRKTDPPSQTLFERCEEFIITPPPSSWDGAWAWEKGGSHERHPHHP
jgi:adenylate cyclase